MAADIEFSVENMAEIQNMFKRLRSAFDKPTIKSTLNQIGDYLISKGQENAAARHTKYSTGALNRSFIKKLYMKDAGVRVGFDYVQRKGKRVFYATMVNFDSKDGERHTKRGWNRGRIHGSQFWSDVKQHDTDTAKEMLIRGIEASLSLPM